MDKLDSLIKFYKQKITYPVKIIYSNNMIDNYGTCFFKEKNNGFGKYKGKYIIELDYFQLESTMIDTLIHEYAHIIRHRKTGTFFDKRGNSHCIKWGQAYSQSYMIFEDWSIYYAGNKKNH